MADAARSPGWAPALNRLPNPSTRRSPTHRRSCRLAEDSNLGWRATGAGSVSVRKASIKSSALVASHPGFACRGPTWVTSRLGREPLSAPRSPGADACAPGTDDSDPPAPNLPPLSRFTCNSRDDPGPDRVARRARTSLTFGVQVARPRLARQGARSPLADARCVNEAVCSVTGYEDPCGPSPRRLSPPISGATAVEPRAGDETAGTDPSTH
jgi:hypothetical protein